MTQVSLRYRVASSRHPAVLPREDRNNLSRSLMKAVPAQQSLFGPLSGQTEILNPTTIVECREPGLARAFAATTPTLGNTATLSVDDTARILGVSDATVRNWARAGHIHPLCSRPLLFAESDVHALKMQIATGSISRLRTRANKSVSSVTRIPKEYATMASILPLVARLVDIFECNELDLNTAMFLATLRVLELNHEMVRAPERSILDFGSFHAWRRKSTGAELAAWNAALSPSLTRSGYEEFYFAITQITEDDLLGILYQSLRQEGDRSHKGSYFTPSHLVVESLKSLPTEGGLFLDPCCGTGQYLLHAAKYLRCPPDYLYGFDSDPLAIRIARINLLLAFHYYDHTPNISCANFLSDIATGELTCETNSLRGRVNLVATNPPWGAYKNSQTPIHLSNGVKSNEAFSLFLAKSLSLMSDKGFLSFILPESLLKIRIHSDIRELLLKTTQIMRITRLGRPFSGVFSQAMRIDIKKGKAPKDWMVTIADGDISYLVPQQRFSENEDCAFDVSITESEDALLRNIYSVDHVTLTGHAHWALGIVTGNNKKFLSDRPGKGLEPIFRHSCPN